MQVEIDPEVDAAYVRFTDLSVARTATIDSQRIIDYGPDDEVVGVEFLALHQGVDLRGLPRHDELARLFDSLGTIPVHA